jgi:hypothetical protein
MAMLGKVAVFAVGYTLGARAGRGRYHQIMDGLRWLAERDEFAMAVGMARSAALVALERAGKPDLRRAA